MQIMKFEASKWINSMVSIKKYTVPWFSCLLCSAYSTQVHKTYHNEEIIGSNQSPLLYITSYRICIFLMPTKLHRHQLNLPILSWSEEIGTIRKEKCAYWNKTSTNSSQVKRGQHFKPTMTFRMKVSYSLGSMHMQCFSWFTFSVLFSTFYINSFILPSTLFNQKQIDHVKQMWSVAGYMHSTDRII
jgi:hypothetical protein